MILTKWQDFRSDSDYYTQANFEKQVKDNFVAMSLERAEDFPNYIWTEHYVVMVKCTTRMINDLTFIKVPRHPSSI